MITIKRNNDNLVELPELKQSSDGSYVTTATVTMTLKDADGATVSGASSLSLTYVSGSNAKYQGTLPDTLSLTVGAVYSLEVTATYGSTVAFWVLEAQVVDRTS